jgi:DNA-binding CsgD family transcriptional regulator
MNTARHDITQANMQTRAQQVLELREQGKTFKDIAAQLGVSRQTAIADRNRALAALAAETLVEAAQYRALNTQRLETMYAAVEQQAEAGEPKAIDAALKIIDRLNALYGLTRTEQNTGDTTNNFFVLDFGSGARDASIDQRTAPAQPDIIQSTARRALTAGSHEHEQAADSA